MANALDSGGNVAVDFVWGPFPIQPDDARGANTLDMALDSHSIVDVGWSGYPQFLANDTDDIVNVTVPNVVDLLEADAGTALVAAGLIKGTVTTAGNGAGATVGNNGKVKTQTPAAGATANTGDAVALVVYLHT